MLGPINLNLLGLSVRTNQINLRIDAIPGAGNLLGNLLCGITNLLNPGSDCHSASSRQALNAILALLNVGIRTGRRSRRPVPCRGPVVIFSGIQPTGRKHLGNYIGAILNYVKGQDTADPAIYCIVDLHGTTVAYDPQELRQRTRETAALLVAAGPRPRALHPLPPGRRAGAHRADLAAVERDLRRPAQPHAPVPRQGGRGARAGLRRPALLPGADGRRRARLPRPRGAGGGGPARAHRAHARRRGGVQQALRRDARRARGQHPDGRRPRARPQGPREEDVDHGRHAAGHGLRRRGARVDHQEVQEGGRGLRAARSSAATTSPGSRT